MTQTHYVRSPILENGFHICPCCKKQAINEAEALDCCQFNGMIHIKECPGDKETICGIPADNETQAESEIIGFYDGEGFDPNAYCHFCLREDQNN